MPDEVSLSTAFERAAGLYGPKPFLRAPASSAASSAAVEYSYSTTLEAVDDLRRGYVDLGLAVGDRVALAFDSCLDVYLHLLALNAQGASLVPLNSSASDNELHHVIEHSGSRHVVALPQHADRLRAIVADDNVCSVLTPEELDSTAAAGEPPSSIGAGTEAALLYTSGTTGQPKACMLSNDYFLGIGRWYVGLGGLCQLDSDDRLVTPLPPNHMNALCTSFTAMMLCGGCLIQLDRFHPKSWWQTLRDEHATVIHYLGVMPAILLTLPVDAADDFSGQVRFGFGAGSDPRHQAVFEERFGFPLIEAWAMTETGSGGIIIADREPRHVGQRCIGKPVTTMDYRIVDEQDNDVPAGEPGELLCRSKGADPRRGFFSGYYRDEAATAAGWKGGWWHTGDVVRIGPDGSFFFVDRRKNVIRRSGENIAAVEVEAVLLRSPLVANCAVTAVPDEIRGDEVFALIALNEESDDFEVTARSLFEHCVEHLAYFKTPAYIAFTDELPLTGSQKVQRGEVKTQAAALVESGACADLRSLKTRIRR